MPAPAWEFAENSHLLLLQHLRNKFSAPLIIYQCAHRPTICKWRSKFRTYTILFKKENMQATVILNHKNVRNIGQGEAQHQLGGGQAYDR
jgi:hypothetical protein